MRTTIVYVQEPADLLNELHELRIEARRIARRIDLLYSADLRAASDHAYRLADAIRAAIDSREDAE